jgi:hypothetical protein
MPNFGGNLGIAFANPNIKLENFDDPKGRNRQDSLFTGN